MLVQVIMSVDFTLSFSIGFNLHHLFHDRSSVTIVLMKRNIRQIVNIVNISNFVNIWNNRNRSKHCSIGLVRRLGLFIRIAK